MKEIIINSCEELFSILKIIEANPIHNIEGQIRKNYYRGQANKEWELIPSILREKDAIESTELENLNIGAEEDKKKISLAIAQHYGKKTRCLDFTRNHDVALYFACNPSDPGYNNDGALIIWEKDAHKPSWFTNYIAYYTAIFPYDEILSWDFAKYLIAKEEIFQEFIRTKRSTDVFQVNQKLQYYLGEGFMVDFEGFSNDIRIKKQEAALFYFGSEFYTICDNKIIVKTSDFNRLKSDDMYYINLHKLYNPVIENNEHCTKIIIPQHLKKEVFNIIKINPIDLGLN